MIIYFYTIMKRFTVFLAMTLSLLSAFAQKDNLYKWSFTVEGGLNSLDGDGDSSTQSAYGASVEYDFIPVVGVSVDYYHFPESGPAFTTQINSADINLTVNINRLIFSKKDNEVILKGYLGYGLAGYTYKYFNTPSPVSSSNYSFANSFPVLGVSVEFYLNKLLSVGLKSQFRPFNVNTLEGGPQLNLDNITNDNIVAGTIFLRFKLYSAN